MFQKNIEQIRRKNSVLADKLEKIDIKSIDNIKTFHSQSKDLIISYKEQVLNSAVDPIREAKSVWYKSVKQDLKRNDIQIVFGLGLGYLFKRAYVSSDSKIFLYEPFIEILRFVLEYVDLSQEIAQDRVYLTNDYDDLVRKIQNEYLAGDKLEFLFLNSYLQLSKDIILKLTNKIVEICESKGIDQNTISSQCKIWLDNSIRNFSEFDDVRDVGELNNAFDGKPALIISAGPSLAENIDKIKLNRDKFVVIAVCSALKFLAENNVVPDFVMYADSRYLAQHLDNLEDVLEKTNIVMNSRADNYVFSKKSKTKFIYFSETDAISTWLKSSVYNEVTLNKSAGTVSALSFYFAKQLGCNPIVFSGLDLAFLDNKIYANGTELQVDQNGYLTGLLLDSPKKVLTVKSANGNMIPTRDDYMAFIRQFNDIFKFEAKEIKVINTSLNGAYIKGMDYTSLDDVVKSELNSNISIDVNSIVENIWDKSQKKWTDFDKKLCHRLAIEKESIKNIVTEVDGVYKKLVPFCEELENAEVHQISDLKNDIESIQKSLNLLREVVIKNSFLTTYLQMEILEYTRAYNTNILPNIQDLKHNMIVEKDFYTVVLPAAQHIYELIDFVLGEATVNAV